MIMRVPLDKTVDVADGRFRHDMQVVYKAFNVIGETVLPFVIHAGFNSCFLLGCDCTNDGYFYPKEESSRKDFRQVVYPQAIQAYRVINEYLAENPNLTRVYNAGYGGNLDVFPRVHFDSLRPGAEIQPLVVGYHTPHDEYRKLAMEMKESVESFGMTCHIEELPARKIVEGNHKKNWVANCAICPEFIQSMMSAFHGTDIIYLDADAIVRKRLSLYLDEPRDYDFAAPFLTNKWVNNELQSNSLFFKASHKAEELVEAWFKLQHERIERMARNEFTNPYKEAWDQVVLQEVMSSVKGLRVRKLPLTYGKIIRAAGGQEITPDVKWEDAVITQHQASREMKNRV
jgi:hypothetical protein